MRHLFSSVHHAHVRRVLWLTLLAVLILLVTRRVEAQVEQVYTNGPVTVLTEPDWNSPVVDQWPGGVPILLNGCLQDRSWCQVSWGPEQGWVMSSSLMASVGGTTVIFGNWTWPVPLVIFEGGHRYPYPHPWQPSPGHDHDGDHDHDHDRDQGGDHRGDHDHPPPHPMPRQPWPDNNGH